MGIFGYFILSKYSKKSMDHLIWILFILYEYLTVSTISLFLYWNSFFFSFHLIYISKFVYSMFNGPQGAIALGITIRYLENVDPELVLLGTGTIGIVRKICNSVSGSFVGYMMQDDTQMNTIIVQIILQFVSAYSFFCAVGVFWMFRKKDICVDQSSTGGSIHK